MCDEAMSIRTVKNRFDRRKRITRLASSQTTSAAMVGVGVAVAQNQTLVLRETVAVYRSLQTQRLALNKEIANTSPTGRTNLADQGVKHAWEFERALLNIGSPGTREWTPLQGREIRVYGKPTNHTGVFTDRFEGHHINSVAEHPLLQADQDNIRFLTRQEHLEAHGGSWRNPSEGPLFNRSKLFRIQTIRAQLIPLGLMVGAGFAIGVAVSLLAGQRRWSEHFWQGIDGAIMSGISYGGGWTASLVMAKLSIAETLQVAGVGIVASMAGTLYTVFKLKRAGVGKGQILIIAGSQLGISLLGVGLITLVGAKFGKGVAAAIGLAYMITMLIYHIFRTRKLTKLTKKLEIKTIRSLQPALEGGF